MKHLETILESGIFSEINKSDYIIAFESFEITSEKFKRDEVIFSSGEVIDKICIVEKGRVREERVYEDGEVCIIHTFGANSIFALETVVSRKKTAAVDYVCSEDSSIVYIPYKNIEKSKWSREIMKFLLQELADGNFRNMYKINILARRSVRERILLYLNHLKKRTESSEIDVKMDREQMAQFLCVNRSSLSNKLNQLKREGIINFQKNKFIILKQLE
ncbi:MAG: Crp/Fnr family transcriptional regulator [Ruminococcus sp.]|nr:Crp/Fnr family transcriptional regulator [Ruminococcus sp.]